MYRCRILGGKCSYLLVVVLKCSGVVCKHLRIVRLNQRTVFNDNLVLLSEGLDSWNGRFNLKQCAEFCDLSLVLFA